LISSLLQVLITDRIIARKGQEGPLLGEVLQQFAAGVTGPVPAMDQGRLLQLSLDDISKPIQPPSVMATLIAGCCQRLAHRTTGRAIINNLYPSSPVRPWRRAIFSRFRIAWVQQLNKLGQS